MDAVNESQRGRVSGEKGAEADTRHRGGRNATRGACAGRGDKGALLRREGLYSSHIVEWRRARDAGGKSGLGQAQRKKTSHDARALAKANAKIERLESDLAKHKLALGIAGKAHALLEMLAESAQDETKPKQ